MPSTMPDPPTEFDVLPGTPELAASDSDSEDAVAARESFSWVDDDAADEAGDRLSNRDGSDGDIFERWASQPCPVPWRHPLRALWWLVVNAAGSASLALLMAIVAAIPLLNFYVLGVLLDAEGRVARSGKIRDAFWLWGIAPRLGAIALGLWAFLVPVRIFASIASDASLVEPGGPRETFFWNVAIVLGIVLGTHVALALARGGKFSMFFRPIKNARYAWKNWFRASYWERAGDHIVAAGRWMEFRRLWWLGGKGLIVGLGWLVIPTTLYVSAENPEGPQILVTVLGMLSLTAVNCWLPALQANLAAEQTIRSGFALRTVRRQWAAAPVAWMLAIVGLYVLTLPLHLFRVVLPPQDAAWLVTLVFVVTIFPTRIWLGYAAYRSRKRLAEGRSTRWWWRWPLNIAFVGLVGFYTFLLFFTQFIGSKGKGVLFEQHAFLLPWPL